VWSGISGLIVILLGMTFLFPGIWENIMMKMHAQNLQFTLLSTRKDRSPIAQDIIIGASLGPIFNSCSPTYALIIATILPASFANGIVYIVAYAIGVSTSLFLLSIAGRSLIARISKAADNHGILKRSLGVIFLIVGVLVIFGLDKKVQSFILDQGWYAPISNLEKTLAR
jgi:cytochrome c-type biogenesis protein